MWKIITSLVFLLLHVNYAAGSCDWSSCMIKAIVFDQCGSGKSHNGESRDCGSKTCFFGLCTYTHSQHMCCSNGNTCAWYDFACNANVLEGYFTAVSQDVQQSWGSLAPTIQDKLTTAQKFSSLTLSELAGLDTTLLSELKSVTGMTSNQFQSVTGKIHDMTSTHLEHFLSNVSPATLEDGLAALGAIPDWTEDKITKIKERLASSEAWGPLASWNSEKIDLFGPFISGLDQDSIKSFADDALANAASLNTLTSSQLGSLAEKMRGMSPNLLQSMLDKVSDSTLGSAMVQLTSVDLPWATDQVALFKDHLTSSDAWGEVTAWTSTMIGNLGSMLKEMDLATLLDFDDASLAHAVNLGQLVPEQIGALGTKLFKMTSANLQKMIDGLDASALANSVGSITGLDFTWASEQAVAFVEKLQLSNAWGDISQWTSSQLESLGSMLPSMPTNLMALLDDFSLSHAANLVKLGASAVGTLGAKLFGMSIPNLKSMLDGLNLTALVESVRDITSVDFSWASEQASAFVEKLQLSDAWGDISKWTSTQLEYLGSMLPSLPVDLTNLLDDGSFSQAANLIKFGAAQLGQLGSKIFGMDIANLRSMLDGLDLTVLADSVGSITGLDFSWASEQALAFAEKLQLSDVWGDISQWTSTQLESLGSMLPSLPLNLMTLLDDWSLSHAANLINFGASVVGTLGAKIFGMSIDNLKSMLDSLNLTALVESVRDITSVDFSWVSEQALAFAEKLQLPNAWGDISDWAPTQLESLGSMLPSMPANLLGKLVVEQIGALGRKLYKMTSTNLQKMLDGLDVTALTESIGSITGLDFSWASEQALAFAEKLQLSDAWGDISQWTSTQLESLGSMLPSLPLNLMTLLDDWSLSHAANLIKFGAEQLGSLASKVFGMSISNLKSMLDGVNSTALCLSLRRLTSTDFYWLPKQAQAFQNEIFAEESCGEAVSWAKDQIEALGSMLTSLNISAIEKIGNAALARAANLAKLSANTIAGLSNKLGSMDLSDFTPLLEGLQLENLHAAMLSQCNIQCQDDEDLEFLANPNAENAADTLEAYAERVTVKTHAAALAYAKGFCNGGYDEIFAEAQAAAIPCTGSASGNNVVRDSFESWSNSQMDVLLTRLTNNDSFGSIATWSHEKMAALCHQYSALPPSSIAERSPNTMIIAGADDATNAALVATYGRLTPVASYEVAKSSNTMTPEKRAAWAGKLKEGLGNLAMWGCEQVASMRTMISGLDGDDLTSLPLQAIKGLDANAITAMSSSQVRGFSPDQVIAMVEKVRKRLNGNLLRELDVNQIVAAVCGVSDATSISWCPSAAIDLTLGFPTQSLPSESEIIAHFASQLGVSESQVQILWSARDSALPVTIASARRLDSEKTQVAVRIGVTDTSQQEALTYAAQSAASRIVSPIGGQIIEDALSYSTTEDSKIIEATSRSTSTSSTIAFGIDTTIDTTTTELSITTMMSRGATSAETTGSQITGTPDTTSFETATSGIPSTIGTSDTASSETATSATPSTIGTSDMSSTSPDASKSSTGTTTASGISRTTTEFTIAEIDTTTEASPGPRLLQGSLSFSGAGLSKTDVETSCRKALASEFKVNEASVSISAFESRRLREKRQLAGTWTVSFTIIVSSAEATAVVSKLNELHAGSASLSDALKTELVKQGAITESTSLAISSFSAESIPYSHSTVASEAEVSAALAAKQHSLSFLVEALAFAIFACCCL